MKTLRQLLLLATVRIARAILVPLSTLFVLVLLAPTAVRAAEPSALPVISVGIVPQQAASRLAADWGPLLAEAGRRAGLELVFRTAPTIPMFEERMARGEYDIAYMNPYHYVVFNQAGGYRAFAREKDRKIKGIIVVRKDSPVQRLAELANQEVAFPAPAAFAASILTQAEFGRQNIPIHTRFVTSHESVYRAVASGLYVAGGGIQRTFEASAPEVRMQLRVLAETPSFTPHALAAHPRVPDAQVRRLMHALESLSDDDKGRSLLAPLAFKGFVAASDSDWNDIRGLDIKALERYTRE